MTLPLLVEHQKKEFSDLTDQDIKVELLFRDLSDFQADLLRHSLCRQLFAVVSWGCAATSWLATVLNGHPEIFCVHAANHSWHVFGNGEERLDGSPYIRTLANQGSNYAAAGDVHGVSRHHIAELRESLANHFNAAVVVREPIPRLHSQLALFARYETHRCWDIGYVDSVIARTGVTLPAGNYRCRFFVHAANMLNAILDEREVGRIFRSEDLTQSPETLGDFVEEITRGAVSPTTAWLRSAIETRPMNRHAKPSQDPKFADWQVDVIRRVVDPRAWDTYAALGYPPWERSLRPSSGSRP
jgi:hypothetical protein